VLLLRAYQLVVSPLIGANCRFMPTCSQYGIEALQTHGVLRGGWLTLRRVLRCRPGGGSGYDPVPEPNSQQDLTE
jgi:putative membrane protein insertion efficiency factor